MKRRKLRTNIAVQPSDPNYPEYLADWNHIARAFMYVDTLNTSGTPSVYALDDIIDMIKSFLTKWTVE